MENEITLLTKEQVENLDILKKYGKEAEETDFYKSQRGLGIAGKGFYWTKTPDSDRSGSVFNVYPNGNVYGDGAYNTGFGVRPVIPLSQIYRSKIKLNKVLESSRDIVEYGEYPQFVIEEDLEEELENLYQEDRLKKTKKSYTSMLKEEKEKYQEYIYQNNKYIRVKEANISMDDCEFANGRKAIKGETYWLKVEPIEWLIDKNAKIAIAKNVLTAMPFSYEHDNDYEKSVVKVFLEDYFIKEIKPSIDMEKIDNLVDLMFDVYVPKEKKVKQKIKK